MCGAGRIYLRLKLGKKAVGATANVTAIINLSAKVAIAIHQMLETLGTTLIGFVKKSPA
jgi:hypothetical protein